MYIPTNVPNDSALLPGFLMEELRRISLGTSTRTVQLDVLHKAPDRPKDGMVVMADGVFFNPGSGPGFYGYRGGAWRFLG